VYITNLVQISVTSYNSGRKISYYFHSSKAHAVHNLFNTLYSTKIISAVGKPLSKHITADSSSNIVFVFYALVIL
jgi:hypothetical protein